jgi:predicted DNA-binding transcriptional regulator AlpA
MATTWKLTRNADGEPEVEEWGDGPRFGTSLMGSPEIQQRLAISALQLEHLSQHDKFPTPLATLEAGRVWLTDDIEHWIQTHHPLANMVVSGP